LKNLLIIDDNVEIQKQLKWGLGKDFNLFFASDGKEAMRLFSQHQTEVVVLDLGLPPDAEGVSEGFRCLSGIVGQAADTKVIVVTGRGEKEYALRAIDEGAYDFYCKPIDLKELQFLLKRAFHLTQLETENRKLWMTRGQEGEGGEGLFGQCARMQEVQQTLARVASVDVPVLFLGESGTGKEMAARALHAQSSRRDGPFVAINCGAIPETLLESELFGYEKGAFTGAVNRTIGKVEAASGGTLFLDEIGEMTAALQVKLLRFLQEHTIQRVGGRSDIPVDVRILTATNIDIENAIDSGQFREDLYYRISVLTVELPALKDRGEDIELLARIFLHRYAEEYNRKVRAFSERSRQMMMTYAWPGNVRELENKVKRAVVLSEGAIIEPAALGFEDDAQDDVVNPESRSTGPIDPDLNFNGLTLREARAKLECKLIQGVFEEEEGQMASTAKRLGVSRPTLYDLMKKYGLLASS